MRRYRIIIVAAVLCLFANGSLFADAVLTVGAGEEYTTISAAMAALPGTAWNQNYTVDIYSGTYTSGNNTVNEPTNGHTLTIQAQAGATVNVDIGGYALFDVYSNNVTIKGLNGIGSNNDNRLVLAESGASHINVLNNTMTGDSSQAFLFIGANNYVNVTGNTFFGNNSTGGGTCGVIHFWDNGGACNNVQISNNVIYDNVDTGSPYALIHVLTAGSNVVIDHNVLYGNQDGHGIAVSAATGTGDYIINNTVNDLVANSNAGIVAASCKIYNNIVTHVTGVGTGIWNLNGGSTVAYNDSYGNVTNFVGTVGVGNLSVDPQYISTNCQIGPGSPVVDKGESADIPPGYPPYNGLSYDMGYFETPEPATLALLALGGIGMIFRRRKV